MACMEAYPFFDVRTFEGSPDLIVGVLVERIDVVANRAGEEHLGLSAGKRSKQELGKEDG